MNKGVHKALNRFREYAGIVSRNYTRTAWVLKCDIKKFFANIDHKILRNILAKYIKDDEVLRLLGEIIESFNTKNKIGVGLPLGNLTSQLLVNIYMNEFDHFMKRELKVARYIRYADDFVIFYENRKYLEDLILKISEFLAIKLKLALHPDKVFIKTLASGVDFLGWIHFSRHRVLRTATKRRMMRGLEIASEQTPRNDSVIRSYLGLLKWGNSYKIKKKICLLISTKNK